MTTRRPTMVVIAGPNGSGKTTLTRLILEHDWLRGHTYINADEIAERELGSWNSVEAVRTAARLADERREQCLQARQDFVYETVFSTPDRVAFIERAKTAGYFIRLYFIATTNPDINVNRVKSRVGEGGHDVPADKIQARYHRSLGNLKSALSLVDRAYVFDNSVENTSAIRWVRTRDGQIAKLATGSMPAWIRNAIAAFAPTTEADQPGQRPNLAVSPESMDQNATKPTDEDTAAKEASGPDLSDPALLPPTAALAMPPQDFDAPVIAQRARTPAAFWVPRTAVFAGTLLLTIAFAHELYGVLSFVRLTPIQFVFLVLSTVSFGWIVLGALSAAMGFLPLFAGDTADNIKLPEAVTIPRSRSALLVPVYNEDPARIAGTLEAMSEELIALGCGAKFDIFVLSDTRDAASGAKEQATYGGLRKALAGEMPLYYRRRRFNTERKAGNIKDWVERFGAAYPQFLILDADSVMTGDALVRLALAMERTPTAGLIQTVPRLIGATTLLQRLQQFACNTYGPSVASGIAFWHRDQGNYWGHNAMIRTEAFASAAGLPTLPGAAPFGGHILSHDFVEAVLLQRAGWGVHMVPSIDGSFEGLPPALIEMVTRDRRWAQGNLQHLAILTAPGITTMGRIHMGMGAFAYIVSLVWALSLAVGLVLLLQGQELIPSYFEDIKTLHPIWPKIDPGSALRLFMATMAVVLLPKGLGLILEVQRAYGLGQWGQAIKTTVAVMVETVASMLIAPILMMTQTVAVIEILLGKDSGWTSQRRDDGSIPLTEALRYHALHMAVGAGLAILCWNTTPELAIWMAPVIVGLLLSGLINWYTARPVNRFLGWLLATNEDRSPAPTLARADVLTAQWAARAA